MRVIAGTAGGLRLVAPEGRTVRPTTDRVREAIFNALYSLDALDEVRVLDLFAGTGALGIEALSRGAASAVFVERDRHALACLEQNLETTRFADQAHVRVGDAMAFARTANEEFDLAFLDPPYDFVDWDDLIDVVPAQRIVVEAGRAIDERPEWRLDRTKAYGATVVTIMSRRNAVNEVPR